MKRLCIVLVIITSCLWTWLPLAHAQSSPLPDFDQNGVVDLPDFLLFVEHFGTSRGDETYEDRFDLDGDGAIAFSDFLIFITGVLSPSSGRPIRNRRYILPELQRTRACVYTHWARRLTGSFARVQDVI